MWGKPPFVISDNCAVDVANLGAAREWYKEKLGLQDSRARRQDDSGRPFADLVTSGDDTLLSLIESAPGAAVSRGKILLFAESIEKAQKWLAAREVPFRPVMADSGGNRLFEFSDLDGNSIEVSVEP